MDLNDVVQGRADSPTALVEKHAFKQSPSRIEELVKIFIHATKVRCPLVLSLCALLTNRKMETGFWDMAYMPQSRRGSSIRTETPSRQSAKGQAQ